MFRLPATLNRAKCASNVLISQGSRFVRPLSTSAIRLAEGAINKEEHDVESLFDAGSNNSRSDALPRRARGSTCINRIELMGGVADNPVERTGRNGTAYLSFNMFTNVEYRKPNGSFDENVELHNVLVFPPHSNYTRRNIQRGSRVFVSGRLHYSGGPMVNGQVSRVAMIVADVVQAIAKPAPRDGRIGDEDHQ